MFTLSSINHSEINHRDAKGCPSFYQRAQIHWRKFHALNSSFSVSQAVSPYSTMCMTVVVLCSPDAVPTQNLLLNQCPYSSHQELNLTSEFNTLTETMKCHLAAIQTYNNGTLLSAAISQDTQLTLVAPNKRKLTGWEIHYGLISHPLCLCVIPRSNSDMWWLPNGCRLGDEMHGCVADRGLSVRHPKSWVAHKERPVKA